MTHPALVYHWSQSEFLRAWEAGAFDHRVELVEGEVWPRGYRVRREYRRGERIPVGYADTDLAVDELVAPV